MAESPIGAAVKGHASGLATKVLVSRLVAVGLAMGAAFPAAHVLAAESATTTVVAYERDDLSSRLPIEAGSPQPFDARTIAPLSSQIQTKAGGTLVQVTNSDDFPYGSPYGGTFRDAINSINFDCSLYGPFTIAFSIPDPPAPIVPAAPLPPISCNGTLVDGFSQPGSSPNTLASGSNAVIKISLDGTLLASPFPFSSGLPIQADNVEVRGLAIYRMPGHGIETFCGGTGSVFQGNFLGTDPSGAAGLGNGGFGLSVGDAECGGVDGVLIGGTANSARNTIIGNASGGIYLFRGGAITPNEVLRNDVGLSATQAAVGNGGPGLVLEGETGTIVGSLADPNDLNRFVASTGPGVKVIPAPFSTPGGGHQFGINYTEGNSAGIGFDIDGDGPTPNDPGDSSPPQNFPEFTSITFNTAGSGAMRLVGALDTVHTGPFTVLLFGHEIPADFEAGNYLGQFSVPAGGAIDQTLPLINLPVFHKGITATATSELPGSQSSEISGSVASPFVAQDLISIDFGGVAVGGTSNRTVTVSNATALAISSATVSPTGYSVDVSACASVLPPASTCGIVFSFAPTAAGTSGGPVDFVSNSPGLQRIAVIGTGLAPPGVSMSFSPAVVPMSASSQLTITLSNPNPSFPVTGVAFTNNYAVGGLVNAASPGGATTCPGGSVTATGGGTSVALSGGAIPAGGTCTVTVNVTSAVSGIYIHSLSGGITTSNAGTSTASASATLTVMAPPNVSMSFSPATVPVSTNSQLTITLNNPNALEIITGVAFTNTYATGLVNAASPGATTTCSGGLVSALGGGASVALNNGSIPAGGSCTVTVNVTSAASGTYLNVIFGGITTTNAGTSTASASATLTVVGPPNVSMSFVPTSMLFATNSTLTIVLANPNSTVAITGVGFTSTYSAGLVNATPPGAVTSCSGGTVTASGGGNSVALSGGTVPAGGSCTVSVSVTSASAGSYVSSIPGAITTTNAGTGTSSATATLTVTSPLISFSPSSLTFAPQVVGTTSTALLLTVTNAGGGDLVFAATAFSVTPGFALTSACPTTLAPGASCAVSVTFTPTVVGSVTGQLSIFSNASATPISVALSGTGSPVPAPIVTLAPASLSFGTQTVGTSSQPQSVRLTNVGTAPLIISGIAPSTADFTTSGNCLATPELIAGASCDILVVFLPQTAGAKSGFVTITDTAAGSPRQVAVSGTGAEVVSGFTLTPSSIDFPSRVVSTRSAGRLVTLTNTSTATLQITGIQMLGSGFTYVTTCGQSLAPGTACDFTVTFAPNRAGTFTASLHVTTDAVPSVGVVSLSGTAVPVPVGSLSPSPSQLAFGEQIVNTAGSPQSFSITNLGNAAVSIGSISVTGDFALQGECSVVGVGESCVLGITFTPVAVGLREGRVVIVSNASNSVLDIALSGQGIPVPVPAVSFSPSTLSFGNNLLGNSSTLTMTLRNSGTADLAIGSIEAEGDFSRSHRCPAILPPGQSCEIAVVFVPSLPGQRTGALAVTSNAGGSPHHVTLLGVGCRFAMTGRSLGLSCAP